MASATLTAASPSNTFTTTTGTIYSLGATGNLGGGQILLESSLPTSATVFGALNEPISGNFFSEYRAPGTSLKVTLQNASAAASVNVEIT